MSEYDISKHAEMLANRVLKRYRHLEKQFARDGIEAFRLYDWDIPEIRAVVDFIGGHLVVAEYARRQTGPEWLPAMAEAVGQILEIEPEKVHARQRHTGTEEGGPRYRRMGRGGEKIVVRERDLRFVVNFDDFLDIGLFSDHRDTRQMIRPWVEGRSFLNMYCYTGAFTCSAAKAGARTTTSVDRNSATLAWAKENLRQNDLWDHRHEWIKSDAEDFLRRAAYQNRKWDVIFVDPPSFSQRRGSEESFDIYKHHPYLLRMVLAVTAPGGTVVFSTNHQRFVPNFEGLPVESIEDITEKTVPIDFRNKHVHFCWKMIAQK